MSQDSQSNIAVSGSIKAKGGEFTDDVKLVDSQGDPGIPDGLSSAVNKKYVQNLTSNFVSGTTAGSPNTAVTEIRTLTQAQYDALTPSASVMYVIIG
jgi:D-serine dehydratase